MYKNYIFLISIFLNLSLMSSSNFESQSNIIFKNKYIENRNKQIELKTNFNNGVLYLEQKKYLKAIKIFKKTAKKLKVASYLNIGIAYFKLKSNKNAYLYLKKLYDLKELEKHDLYAYVSSSYYLYEITNERKYLSSILTSIKKSKKVKINEHVKLLAVNTYIILKKYKKAIKLLRSLKEFSNLKLALLYIKTKEYDKSSIYFNKAMKNIKDDDYINKMLWFQVYVGLKANNISKIKDNIDKIDKRLEIFKQYPKMTLKIYFNKNKYSSKELFSKINKFDKNKKIDMLFYFVPFIFSDNNKLKSDSTFAFVLNDKNKMNSLSNMIDYNREFIKIVKYDPILRVKFLQDMINKKTNINSYEYYNLALSYAQIYNYQKAYFYFNKAYSLNKANKLYSSLTLVSSLKSGIKIDKKGMTVLKENLLSEKGTNRYIGKYIYKLIVKKAYKIEKNILNDNVKNTTFFRALKYLQYRNNKDVSKNDTLLYKDIKDPLVFLFKTTKQQKNESQYEYIARLQDFMPKNYNDFFIKGPTVVTEYYIDILRALGIFDKVDFEIIGNKNPTYLRTKALINLYDGYPIQSIKIVENLQKEYQLYDKYTFNLLVASYLAAKDYSNAIATLGMLQFELKDADAKFLNAIELLNELKLASSKILFVKKYEGTLIDFKLEGLDEFLDNL